jgi:membrane protein implicated in regulation of membrane protease activity
MYSAARNTSELAMATGAAWATAIAVLVFAVLFGGFLLGSRRAARRRVPPPERQPDRAQERSGSWHAPDESETRHSSTTPPDER